MKSFVGSLFVVTVVLSSIPKFCIGLKHSYKTKSDDRSLIGPLGFPFGFLKKGHYNLTVFDFKITSHDKNDHTHKHDHSHKNHHSDRKRELWGKKNKKKKHQEEELIPEDPYAYMNPVSGVGFLLKRFENEATFNQYMSWLSEENENRCAFEYYIDAAYYEDDDVFVPADGDDVNTAAAEDDDSIYTKGQWETGIRHVHNVTNNGIFLDMKNPRSWKPSTPSVSYDFQPNEEGLYFLIYQVCMSNVQDEEQYHLHTRFELDFHFLNYDLFNNESYLTAGEMLLPHLFFYFSILYASCYYLWTNNIKLIKDGEPGHFSNPGGGQPIVYPIHSVMSAVLLLKTLSIFFESIRYHYIRVSGKAILWSAVYYTFAILKGTMLFTVILLIGSGWSFVKPFLTEREKTMIFVVLLLQVINNIAIVVLTQETEGEHSFDKWTAILHMVDILCCCAVLIPIVWHVNSLEKNIEQSAGTDHSDMTDNDNDNTNNNTDLTIPEDEFDESSSGNVTSRVQDIRLVSKLRLFRSFYLLVVTYIYVTRIVVYLFATMLDYRHLWVRTFVVEAVTFAFYCMVGMQFRPMGENPYLSIRNNEYGNDDDTNPSAGRKTKSKIELELTA